MATTVVQQPKVNVTKTGNTITIKPKLTKKAARKAKRKAVFKKIVGKVVGGTLLLPLQPFKPAMKKDLESKGYSTKGLSFPTIIEKFFNENISKKKQKASSFEEIPEGYLNDNYLMRTPLGQENETDSLAADAIVLIVQETIKFFKNKKDKKAAAKNAGENPADTMTNSELEAAAAAEKVTKDLEKKATDEKSVTTGKMNNVMKIALVTIGIALVLWIVSKKLK
jgi:hypothetical protein